MTQGSLKCRTNTSRSRNTKIFIFHTGIKIEIACLSWFTRLLLQAWWTELISIEKVAKFVQFCLYKISPSRCKECCSLASYRLAGGLQWNIVIFAAVSFTNKTFDFVEPHTITSLAPKMQICDIHYLNNELKLCCFVFVRFFKFWPKTFGSIGNFGGVSLKIITLTSQKIFSNTSSG